VKVEKYAVTIRVSSALISSMPDLGDLFDRRRSVSPEEHAETMRKLAADRAAVRAEKFVGLGLSAAVAAAEERMGWKPGFIAHLAQPYCECYDGHDGWVYCEHAADLGLRPW